LRKRVRVSKELDEVLLTESNHAESANGNRRQLGGRSSALMADHARASEYGRSQPHASTVLAPRRPALWRVGCLLRMTLFKGLFLGRQLCRPHLPLVNSPVGQGRAGRAHVRMLGSRSSAANS